MEEGMWGPFQKKSKYQREGKCVFLIWFMNLVYKYWWPILSFIFMYCISRFLSIFSFTCAPFLFFLPLPPLRFIGCCPVDSHFWIHQGYFFCTDWTISEAGMSAYFTYRYYTAKQNDVRGEENGRNREEAYLQAQWCKWENVLRGTLHFWSK